MRFRIKRMGDEDFGFRHVGRARLGENKVAQARRGFADLREALRITIVAGEKTKKRERKKITQRRRVRGEEEFE